MLVTGTVINAQDVIGKESQSWPCCSSLQSFHWPPQIKPQTGSENILPMSKWNDLPPIRNRCLAHFWMTKKCEERKQESFVLFLYPPFWMAEVYRGPCWNKSVNELRQLNVVYSQIKHNDVSRTLPSRLELQTKNISQEIKMALEAPGIHFKTIVFIE